jgi:hypothetical protein
MGRRRWLTWMGWIALLCAAAGAVANAACSTDEPPASGNLFGDHPGAGGPVVKTDAGDAEAGEAGDGEAGEPEETGTPPPKDAGKDG